MKHYQLINIAKSLGYSASISDLGLCKGFSGMWVQAVCSGDISAGNNSCFLQRLKILEHYASTPDLLNIKINQVRELVKKGIVLTENQQALLEIPAFFEGIALYLSPHVNADLFGKNLFQQDQVEISQYTQSKELEKQGGLKCAFRTTDQYTQTRLTNYLKSLSDKLQGTPNVAIQLGANNHSVAVHVLGNDTFQLIDTNHLNKMGKRYTSKELAKELNISFNNNKWFSEPKPLVIATSILANNETMLDLETLRATSPLKNLVTDNNNFPILLRTAVIYNDLATLRLINFDTIAPEDFTSVLSFAVLMNNIEITEYLLAIPGLDVNKTKFPYPPALFVAIDNKNYELGKKILEHPSFISQNDSLHMIAEKKQPGEQTMLFARHLMQKQECDVNKKNGSNNTPLYLACKAGNIELARLFLDNGAQLDALNFENRNALHAAAFSGNKDLVQLLVNRGLDLNQVTAKKESVLHYATQGGSKEVVELLITNGADCNSKTIDGETPLNWACKYNHPELIPALLAKTTLSRKDIEPDFALSQLVTRCGSNVQKIFLIKALEAYIRDREKGPDYFNFLKMGIHKDDKIAAAKALLNTLNGSGVHLERHHDALNSGFLSSLYNFYNKNLKNLPQHDSKNQPSYSKMCAQFDITSVPPKADNYNHENKAAEKRTRINSTPIMDTDLSITDNPQSYRAGI